MVEAAVLSVGEMYRADALAIEGGVAGLSLMEAAGTAIARAIRRRWRPRPVAVLCGPGNNGGDGFVVARLLRREGWPVRLGLLGAPAALKGDAAANRDRWSETIHALAPDLLDGAGLVVDALFGAGLARPIEGIAAETIVGIDQRGLDCVGVDVPSGVHGDTGAVLGIAPHCRLTVTFFRAKPGHLLLPGRSRCGELLVADIGIPAAVLDAIRPETFHNVPGLWRERFPRPRIEGNKYHRGHALIAGGAEMTGAARLAAEAARRTGAGLVTLAVPAGARALYAAVRPGTIVASTAEPAPFAALIADRRRTCALIGPGVGLGTEIREQVLAVLRTGKPCVLDADALTVFRDAPAALFREIRGPCLMTPHEGEFARIFETAGDKPSRARAAARASGATILLKGPDTIIAAADGRAAINTEGSPDLATAGSGDVLAGIALGLIAQGMSAFDAACAAAWLHGRIAAQFGPGLIAEDLIDGLAPMLRSIRDEEGPDRR
jgi:NAD(P)H-hydrate epimerase